MSTHKDPCGCMHDGKHTWHFCPKHEAEHRERRHRAQRDHQQREASKRFDDLL